ncbi:protein-disulfide reductase DsbD [Kangiella geojedonensis]|uniref:Thiol:disulfide interchange protein DsbD n=1 Tax=Kangiella geojedonensis TaxID=914150 RepID=A0A0F6RDK1_9GAMM|nr:protein-disulfide reductase DsbD [Kangiella geojedonensis]AKE53021.1 Thiol:disulfide interchange protein DsbD [Kangiella geojedonensis]
MMTMRYMKNLIKLLAAFTLIFSASVQATNTIDLSEIMGEQEALLKVDEAFKLSVDIVDDKALVKFEIADGYYMYSERLKLSSPDAVLGDANIPEGKEKDDPYLGLTQVHYTFLEASVPIKQSDGDFTLVVDYQGCAEDRLCYPPTTTEVELNHAVGASTTSSSAETVASAGTSKSTGYVSEQQKHSDQLLNANLFSNFFYFLLLGIGLAFTPCVFPMMPIISGIIAGQGKDITTRKAFGLSLTYTQAMAIVYTILGIVVALAGQSISGYFQNPAVVISAAVIFVILSLSMFGFYELQLPASLQAKLSERSNQQKKGSYVGTAIMGAISALIVSPCVTVPLIAILLVIAQSGDVLLGAVSLYGLGVGMGIPLIVIGVTGGKLLPKAGAWMDGIKATFGVAMLGVALYLIKHLLPSYLYMYGWGILAIVPGYYLFSNQLPREGWSKLFKGLGLVTMIYGVLLLIGGAQGQKNLLQPLGHAAAVSSPATTSKDVQQSGHLTFQRVKTLEELNAAVAEANSQGKTVMLDFFAEWCAACYEFEEKVFTDKTVISALSNTVLLQADVTENNANDIELLQAYDVLGLPSIMFFDEEGKELPSFRATGFEDARAFEQRVRAAFNL